MLADTASMAAPKSAMPVAFKASNTDLAMAEKEDSEGLEDGHLEIYKWLLVNNVERRLFDASVGKRVKVEQEQQVARCFTTRYGRSSLETMSKASKRTSFQAIIIVNNNMMIRHHHQNHDQ